MASSCGFEPGARRGEGGEGEEDRVQHQENEGTVLTSELSMTCSHTENKRTSTIPKLYRLEGTPRQTPYSLQCSTPTSSAAPQLHPVLIPAAAGILPHLLTVLVLKLSLLPPENWEGGTD